MVFPRRSVLPLVVLAACTYAPTAATLTMPDAAADAFTCKPTYDLSLVGFASKYRIDTTSVSWRSAETACEADGGHLFSPDNDLEVATLALMLSGGKRWIGLVQLRNQLSPAAGWHAITGPAITLIWKSGKPDDNGGTEDGNEQVGTIEDNGLDDDDHNGGHSFVCECDGLVADASLIADLP